MKRFVLHVLFGFGLLLQFSTAYAQSQNRSLSEQEIETRARDVGRSLRCVVCQNQSIDESDAPLAGDMRQIVRTQIRAGKSNEDVLDFMQNRYGDYVLLKPPVQRNTYVLWFAPFVILFVLVMWYALVLRRKPQAPVVEPLSNDEREHFNNLTSETSTDKAL